MAKAYKSNKQQEARYPSELLDQFLFFQNSNNDHQIRSIIRFESQLDLATFEKAVALSVQMIPIIGCRFVESRSKSYWQKLPDDINDHLVDFLETDDTISEINKYLSKKPDEFIGPQIRIGVIRSEGKDTLCIVLNHMVFDGSAFKEYLYLLGQLYTRITEKKTAVENKQISRERSFDQVFKQFNLGNKIRLVLLHQNTKRKQDDPHFPRALNGNREPIFILHELPQNKFFRLKLYGKENNVTINDIVLSAYYRALYKIIKVPDGKSLNIPCMVDLRRYLPTNNPISFCNLSSMIETKCEYMKNFEDTVQTISMRMNNNKKKYPGLNGLGMLSVIYRMMPYSWFKEFMIRQFSYPKITITNLGIIDSNKLRFINNEVKEAIILTALKYSPYFQLAFSTFKDVLTFSVSLYGTKADRDTMKEFFEILDEELPCWH